MLEHIPEGARIYIACGYTDLRKQIDGLAAMVKESFQLDPFQNAFFLFCGRKRDRLKALYWEGAGFLLLYKRLEGGTYQWPRSAKEVQELTPQQLFPQEGAHVGDALFLFVPSGSFQLKLLLILAQTVNLFGDVLIVGSGAGSLQKLLLQFGQPLVGIGKRLAFFKFQNSFDVLLQGGEEGVLVTPCLIDGGNQHLLNLAFRHGAGVAEQPGVFKSADAPPDDGTSENLTVMSKFHNYSFRNTFLIAMQNTDASLIAGFYAWKNDFDRNVKKGKNCSSADCLPYSKADKRKKLPVH